MPDTTVPVDGRPATALVPGFDQACAALATSALKIADRTVVSWDQFTAYAATANAQEQADEIYRAVARSRGVATADLCTVLDLSAAAWDRSVVH